MKKQYFLCILALILVATMLTGCTQKQPRKDYSSSTTAASQKKDAGARLESYLKTASPDTSTATDNIGAKLEQTIANSARLKVKECNDTSVLVEITAPDIPALVAKIRANGGGAEELLEALESGKYSTTVKELTLEIDENGHPTDAWAFADAMYGGLLTCMEQLVEEMEADK